MGLSIDESLSQDLDFYNNVPTNATQNNHYHYVSITRGLVIILMNFGQRNFWFLFTSVYKFSCFPHMYTYTSNFIPHTYRELFRVWFLLLLLYILLLYFFFRIILCGCEWRKYIVARFMEFNGRQIYAVICFGSVTFCSTQRFYEFSYEI